MDSKGDIPSRSEIDLELNEENATAEAVRKIKALETLVKDGNAQGHIYLPNTPAGNVEQEEAQDFHIDERFAHFFPEQGYLFWHADDEDHWVFGEDIIMMEAHYEH